MKTAMQELVEEMEQSPLMFAPALALIKEKNFLEKEKEQMIDFAFKYGDLTTREISDSFDKEYKTNEK
jgi:hypothetical protein